MDKASLAFGVGMLVVMFVLYAILFVICILAMVGVWKSFKKAGIPGWISLIPGLNNYVMLKLCGLEVKWLAAMFLAFVPFVGMFIVLVLYEILMWKYYEVFGISTVVRVVSIFIPFVGMIVLGSKKHEYIGGIELEL